MYPLRPATIVTSNQSTSEAHSEREGLDPSERRMAFPQTQDQLATKDPVQHGENERFSRCLRDRVTRDDRDELWPCACTK